MPLTLNNRSSFISEMLKSIAMKSSDCHLWKLMLSRVLSKSLQKSLKEHLSEKVKTPMYRKYVYVYVAVESVRLRE